MILPAIFTSQSSLVSPELILATLHAVRHKFFVRLVVATVLVMIGVVLEEAEEFPISGPRLNMASGLYIPRYGWLRWRKRIAKFGWLLIVFGVLGEGWYEVRVSNADGNLETFTEKEAGNAATSAKTAHDEADAATLASGKAQGTANAANLSSDQAKRKADAVEQQAEMYSILMRRYVDSREMRHTPREFPVRLMLSVLRKASPANAIILYRSVDTSEPYRAALTISKVLKDAGWTISEPFKYSEPYNIGSATTVDGLPFNLGPLPEMGGGTEILIISTPNQAKYSLSKTRTAAALREALLTSGGSIQWEPNEHMPDGTFVIIVGRKLPTVF